jgi:hypothetical protein
MNRLAIVAVVGRYMHPRSSRRYPMDMGVGERDEKLKKIQALAEKS